MRISKIQIAAAFCALAACTPPETVPDSIALAPVEEFTYAMYDEVLRNHVDDRGFVNYRALKQNRAPLDAFVAQMGAVSRPELDGWPESERLAFWINAYNAITLAYIIDHYPIEKGGLISGALYPANSIRQISGVWDKLSTRVAGEMVTLDAIEHSILRKQFSEPRIHFAIVCASVGCPPLRNEAFVADRLEEQLSDQTRQFLAHPDRFRIDRDAKKVYLSPIFDWFGKDFVPGFSPAAGAFAPHDEKLRAVLNFVAGEVSEADAAYLRNERYRIEFSDYDWSLNEQ